MVAKSGTLDRVTCSNCGTINHLNPEKHTCLQKLCRKCRAVVADPTQPFTAFSILQTFLASLPILRQQIEKNKKKADMRARSIRYENTLRLQEEVAKRNIAKMLTDFPHLQRWAE